MPPAGSQTRFSLNTAQMVLLAPQGAALTPASADVDTAGGPGQFAVKAGDVTDAWVAAPDNSSKNWLSVTSPTAPTQGDGTVSYAVEANDTGPARSGTIDIAALSLEFTVNQASGKAGGNAKHPGEHLGEHSEKEHPKESGRHR